MYLSFALHGQATSFWPGLRACRPSAGTVRIRRHRGLRARPCPFASMIFMFTATYAESVISTPMWAIFEPRGPHREGHDVHRAPLHASAKETVQFGAHFFGVRTNCWWTPASISCSAQMNVRSSTRATSLGRERVVAVGSLDGIESAEGSRSTSSWQSSSYSR